jgi:hypothetical protein
MKIIFIIATFLLPFFSFCQTKKNKPYIFTQPYCEKVTVGGVVGVREKCFKIGDTIVGKKLKNGKIKIRIAKHSKVNEGKPSNMSYQEFMEIPMSYFIKSKKK